MNLDVAYQGHSGLVSAAGGARSLRLAANLQREAVAFDASLRTPLRFREAISALHDVVISDLRFKPRDREAYDAWKRAERSREMQVQRTEYERLKKEILDNKPEIAPEFEKKYNALRRRYWQLRSKYSMQLMRRNPEMWRLLMPCDPVVTVADDVVFFECFSADQSSYGCLTVNRDDAFGSSSSLQLGTTNVDYSWALYDHFQTLRSYRETRLKVDPDGVAATTTGGGEHREEKIDLPDGWLRGFMQLQSAMTLPMRRVTLSRDAVYSILAWLKRHKAHKSPRAMRFSLSPGQAPEVILEPWQQRFTSYGTTYDGSPTEPIRIWGARRVLSLARLLPLMESCDVYLLGTGMPSFWVARMGEMRLTLGLSGWTVNDWSSGSALEALLPPGEVGSGRLQSATNLLRKDRALSFDALQAAMVCNPGDCAATLNQLALSGQVIHDLAAGVYRWRQVMPMPVGPAEIGSESPELVASRRILQQRHTAIISRTIGPSSLDIVVGNADGKSVKLVLDADGAIKRGICDCSHHRRAGIRRGPCRHLLALRAMALGQAPEDKSTTEWYNRLLRLSKN
ncbi:metal-binding protein [Aeoliella sp. ICT_H6.2]|uniref:Metal-binding protein n=1 Tax=Aeoliella straminimaris TaxID=2954799 RepID=A0A9X2FHZ0_9BACT|nr:metal-binding protein [Aeoliella straminimaris]MCO6046611.1 metal-binding protein [Aeoliella straminimaris]